MAPKLMVGYCTVSSRNALLKLNQTLRQKKLINKLKGKERKLREEKTDIFYNLSWLESLIRLVTVGLFR